MATVPDAMLPLLRQGLGFALSLLLFSAVGLAQAQSSGAFDEEAARALASKNDCFKCHAIDKAKKAPAYKKIASRLKSKPDAVETIVEHITAGGIVQLEDGTDEKHRVIESRDPAELRNLALWILSL